MEKEKAGIMEIIRWQESYPEGFHGILTNPDGESGFLSRIGTGSSWTRIGEGQDSVEVMNAARNLHNAIATGVMDGGLLGYLGREVERLSRPKN